MKNFCIVFLVSILSLLVVKSTNASSYNVEYDSIRTSECCEVFYSDTTGNVYLRKFRQIYQLNQLITNDITDLQKAKTILSWANSQWEHLGSNSADKDDAFYILEKVAEGERFSCSEFATVFVTAANSIGLPARKLNLKTKDAATIQSSAGHSSAEVYLNDIKKWVLCDPQNDILAMKDDIPLNACELQLSINQYPDQIDYFYKGEKVPLEFGYQIANWFYPYLYFLDIYFDNRYPKSDEYKCLENNKLILVPKGEEAPKVFQLRFPMVGYHSTNSIADFYQAPVFK